MTGPSIRIYVPNLAEFSSLTEAARLQRGCQVKQVAEGYTVIDATTPIEFTRKELGLKPAVWYGIFTGGLRGCIETFDRDRVRITPG
jgi:hypothetical protein